jgi:predicted metal-binding protein
MDEGFDAVIEDALELGAARAVVINTSDIAFHEEFRKACERNACGKYGTNWMGPPAVGPVDELMAKARAYSRGLLLQTIHPVSGSFDMKGMIAGGKAFDEIFRLVLACMRDKHGIRETLPLGAGCCRICPKCAYLDHEPCRHQDLALSSLKAYGMDVMALARDMGIPYRGGPKSVAFFGLILFNSSVGEESIQPTFLQSPRANALGNSKPNL